MNIKKALLWLVGMHRPSTKGQGSMTKVQGSAQKTRPPLCPICKGKPLGPIQCDCGECDCGGFLLDKPCPFCGGAGVVPHTVLRAYEAAAAAPVAIVASPAADELRMYRITDLKRRYNEAAKGN